MMLKETLLRRHSCVRHIGVIGAAPLESSGGSSKRETPRGCAQRNENTCPHRNSYTDIHNSVIHNCQKMETTQMSS